MTICQRCASGSFDQAGIPWRTTPLVKIQKISPGVACCTPPARRLGPLLEPPADSPWHSAQCCPKSFCPAVAASGSLSSGLRLFRSFSGTLASTTSTGSSFRGRRCCARAATSKTRRDAPPNTAAKHERPGRRVRFHERPPNRLRNISPNPENSLERPHRNRRRWLVSFRPNPGEIRSVQPEGRFQATAGAR